MKEKKFNLKSLKSTLSKGNNRFEKRIAVLKAKGQNTSRITSVVDNAIKNINADQKSFVIYGEPQSGKTELMIALTAKLLDKGFKIIIELMNDSVQLLGQNLERFQRSGLSPSPKKFSEILAPEVEIGDRQWIIFCKKNSQDLKKLLTKIQDIENIVVIDDEADYATPNSKINEKEKSTINELTGQIIKNKGIYIGVTATPARLDLNRTHENVSKNWIDFPPHDKYKGQDVFFPLDLNNLPYKLSFIPNNTTNEEGIKEALFSFMVNVANINLTAEKEENFSLLIHTSGKKSDHSTDYKLIIRTFESIRDEKNKNHSAFLKKIWKIAHARYPKDADNIVKYILNNSERHNIVVMNSDKEKNAADNHTATSPSAPFTVVIGGNIVSRGVTFDNLLSMYFNRDVKHKLQQDTYIQRARMFGSREKHLKYFELSIPKPLFLDWQKCFIFHRLSLESRQQDNTTPVWLDGQRVTAVASASIDNTRVTLDKGEMSFALFDYPNDDLLKIISRDIDPLKKLKLISKLLGTECLPKYLISYMESFQPSGTNSIAIHNPNSIGGYKDKIGETDRATIIRSRGFIGKRELEEAKFPSAIHHINILFNETGKARIFYKYKGDIRFLKAS